MKKLTNSPDIQWINSSFIVVAYRWSDLNNHNYFVGIYKTLESAKHNAKKEVFERGGKYGTIIYASKKTKLIPIYEVESPYKGKLKPVILSKINNEHD